MSLHLYWNLIKILIFGSALASSIKVDLRFLINYTKYLIFLWSNAHQWITKHFGSVIILRAGPSPSWKWKSAIPADRLLESRGFRRRWAALLRCQFPPDTTSQCCLLGRHKMVDSTPGVGPACILMIHSNMKQASHFRRDLDRVY